MTTRCRCIAIVPLKLGRADRPEIQRLATQGNDPALTAKERTAAYHELFRKVTENVLMVPICFSQNVWAYDNDLIGVQEADGLVDGPPDLRYLARIKH